MRPAQEQEQPPPGKRDEEETDQQDVGLRGILAERVGLGVRGDGQEQDGELEGGEIDREPEVQPPTPGDGGQPVGLRGPGPGEWFGGAKAVVDNVVAQTP